MNADRRMMLPDGRIVPLTDVARAAVLGAVGQMARDALRCLAIAVKVRWRSAGGGQPWHSLALSA